MSVYSIKALLILDSDGNRVFAQYYAFDGRLGTRKNQMAFEKTLYSKSAVQKEILLIDDYIALYKSPCSGLTIYVIGVASENELLLLNVLNTFVESLSILIGDQLNPKQILNNPDYMYSAADEIVDDGIILSLDPRDVASRIPRRIDENDILTEQKLSQTMQTLREQTISFFSGI